jgi:ribosomal protein S18 acetylase RimI-like enzyme
MPAEPKMPASRRKAKTAICSHLLSQAEPARQGAHLCNCGYIVGEKARGKGITTKMCKHSQKEAIAQDFRAMQFNLVVSTNEDAIRLWQKLGFEIIGILPETFHHPQLGYVDAFVICKQLAT